MSTATRRQEQVTVSPISAETVAAVHALFQSIVGEAFPHLPPSAIESYRDGWSLGAIRDRAADARSVMLAALDAAGAPVGLCFGTRPEGGVGTIIWLLAAAHARGSGVGPKLLGVAETRYRQLGAHKIKLTAPSARARDFYVRNGFEIEGFHHRHWFGADFWAMGRFLDAGQTES